MRESTWDDEVMSDKEQVEMWESVAKVFDDLLTQIRETAGHALHDHDSERRNLETRTNALLRIMRLIGEPTHNDGAPSRIAAKRIDASQRLDAPRGQK